MLEIPSEGEFEYLLELLYFDCAVGQIDVALPIKILVIPDIKKYQMSMRIYANKLIDYRVLLYFMQPQFGIRWYA